MKRKVNIGNEFEGEMEIIEPKDKLIDTKVRAVITVTALSLGSLMIVGSAVMGLVSDPDFSKLQAIWSIIGPIFGIVGGYFYKQPDNK